MEKYKVAIIGGGNLGSAIAEGIICKKLLKPEDIYITRRRPQLLGNLARKGVNVLSDNKEAVLKSKIVILAIKPWQVIDVITEIRPALDTDKTIISMVSGVELVTLQKAAGSDIAIFRGMPNTAIAIGESITCIAGDNRWNDRLPVIESLFKGLGEVAYISEELMAAATVLGSCAIAYALRFIRAAMQGGVEIGFSPAMSRDITAQVMKGAAELILKSKSHPEEEIDKVTTPKGVTICGLNEMEHEGFSSALIQGLISSYKKIENKK